MTHIVYSHHHADHLGASSLFGRNVVRIGDPTPFFAKYGDNAWAAVKEYQAAQVAYASAPVIKKYTGVLAAADVYTASTTFVILESVRRTSVWARRFTPDPGYSLGCVTQFRCGGVRTGCGRRRSPRVPGHRAGRSGGRRS